MQQDMITSQLNYGAIGESVGVKIHNESPIVHTLPIASDREKMTIIPDEPRQMTVAFDGI